MIVVLVYIGGAALTAALLTLIVLSDDGELERKGRLVLVATLAGLVAAWPCYWLALVAVAWRRRAST